MLWLDSLRFSSPWWTPVVIIAAAEVNAVPDLGHTAFAQARNLSISTAAKKVS